jgi:hypothetical protein
MLGLEAKAMSTWNIFSNHGHVLLYLAREPDARLRDVAANVGITERAVQKIVRDMQDAGVVDIIKQGRRNSYQIDHAAALRHELEAHCTVGQLVNLLVERPAAPAPAAVVAVKPAPAPAPEPAPKPVPIPAAKPAEAPAAAAPATAKKPKAKPGAGAESADKPKAEQGSLF